MSRSRGVGETDVRTDRRRHLAVAGAGAVAVMLAVASAGCSGGGSGDAGATDKGVRSVDVDVVQGPMITTRPSWLR